MNYAADNVRAARWPESEAPACSRAEFDRLLPRGRQTPGHFFYEMRDGDGHAVGHLWFAAVGTGGARGGFVYDIHVKPEFRRRGHAALERLEAIAVEMELASIALRVFASNTGAQALYRAAGWDIASIDMRKPLQRT